SAPSYGAGKSLLQETISVVSTGQRATSITYGHSREELEKRVDSVVLAGDPIVCLDNISASLGGDNLCAFVTSAFERVRVMGRTDVVTVPCSTFWMASGVNLSVRGDMVRRSMIARIDPNTANPEKRTGFKIPRLIEYVTENRMRLLSAVFTVLRGHARAGFPG